MKKILILYTSVGLGHKSLAENIGWHLARADFEVKLADVGAVQRGKFERALVAVHQLVNKRAPFLWGWLYRFGHYAILPFRVGIARFNSRQTRQLIEEFRPDMVITTQTSASAVIAYLKEKKYYGGLFGIAFSDYHLHPYWLYPQADFYLANTKEQQQDMADRGIAAEKVFVCGITLRPPLPVSARAVREKLGVPAGYRVVLVGTGSLGIGFKLKDLAVLARLPKTTVIFACGRNEELRVKLAALPFPNVIPLGFYRPMDELYAVADVMVGKPGGLTTAEILRCSLPLVMSFMLPGQEELNAGYLARRNLVIARPRDLAETVETELDTHEFQRCLASNPFVAELVGDGRTVVAAVKRMLG